jgi:nicotinamide phosphoribosyltransferase
MSSRGGRYKKIPAVGIQLYIKKHLLSPITARDIDEAEEALTAHGEPFNRKGWEYILKEHNGFLPISIKAVPEGTIVSPHDVIMVVENTDKENVAWLDSWLETLLLKTWYPMTIAAKSLAVREELERFHMETVGNIDAVPFAFHNFGDRGSSSVESAAIAGMAHLTQFMGTDNFNSTMLVRRYYGEHMAGFSIPASEHSTVTSWGRDREYDMITHYLEKSKGRPIIACVMDSYDVYKSVNFVTTVLKDKIESDEYPIFVIRPDSGEPIEVIGKILDVMEKNNVSYTVNTKGFKLFNKYRLIWGDGITPETISDILKFTQSRNYAANNFAFGSGGDLCQNLTRDTCKFAFKCSAAIVNGEERDVFKDPITDAGKTSLKGRQTLIRWKTKGWADKKVSQIQTIRLDEFDEALHEEILVEVFRDGKLLKDYTFAEVRENTRTSNY